MQANKNGFFYVLDRITGELISAEPFALVSWATGIDMKTGRPIVVPEAYYTSTRGVTVAPVQGHGASPMAFSPITGLVYFPGTALINGKRVDVITEGSHIERGTPVKVVALEGMRVVVRAI